MKCSLALFHRDKYVLCPHNCMFFSYRHKGSLESPQLPDSCTECLKKVFKYVVSLRDGLCQVLLPLCANSTITLASDTRAYQWTSQTLLMVGGRMSQLFPGGDGCQSSLEKYIHPSLLST